MIKYDESLLHYFKVSHVFKFLFHISKGFLKKNCINVLKSVSAAYKRQLYKCESCV